MRRTLIIATFLLLCASAAVSQSRSHGMSFSGRSFGARHFSHGGHFGGGRHFGGRHFRGSHFRGTRVFVSGSFGFRHNRFGVFFGHGFRHRRFFFPGFAYYGAPYYGYGYYPYYPSYPYYGYGPYYAYPRPAYPIAYQSAPAYDRDDDGLAREVDRLRDEVDRLRDERSDRYDRERVPQPPQSEARPSAAVQPTTILIFRNGKREETGNYAVAGQTLWIFSEQRARKVPLSDLDLAATRAANEERGVEFNAGRR